MKKLILTAIVIVLAFGSFAYAQTSRPISITVFPAVAEHALEPGDSVESSLTIQNTESAPLPVQVSVTSLLPFDEVTSPDDIGRYDASRWFSLPKNQAVLQADEPLELDYSIDVPEDAAPGGHYAQITVRRLRISAARPDSNAAEIVPEVKASVLITVAGEIDESLALNTDGLSSGRIDQGNTHEFKFFISNDGNVHSLPAVSLDITKDGQPIESINFQPQLILPGTQKQFEAEWLADKDYGEYEARVLVEYGTPKQFLESEASHFTITPKLWQMIAAVAGGSLLLLMVLRWRQLPRAFRVLKGRAAGVAGSYKRSGGSEEMDDSDDSDYSEVVKELERQRPILGLPVEETAVITDEDTAKVAEAASQREAAKRKESKTQELIAEEIKRDAQISEEVHENTDSKTVIIQTDSTTIVREEPLIEQAKADKEPTVTKIMVVDHDENELAKRKQKTGNGKQESKSKSKSKKKKTKQTAKNKTSVKKTKSTPKTKKKSVKKTRAKKRAEKKSK